MVKSRGSCRRKCICDAAKNQHGGYEGNNTTSAAISHHCCCKSGDL